MSNNNSPSLPEVLNRLAIDLGGSAGPEALEIPFRAMLHFLSLCSRLRETIARNQRTSAVFQRGEPPMFLDTGTEGLLVKTLGLSSLVIRSLWSTLRGFVWSGNALPEVVQSQDLNYLASSTVPDALNGRGKCWSVSVGSCRLTSLRVPPAAVNLMPPSLYCSSGKHASTSRLSDVTQKNIVVFGKDEITPGYATSLYCRGTVPT